MLFTSIYNELVNFKFILKKTCCAMLFYEEKAQENDKSTFTKEMVEHKIVRLVIFERNQKCINAA